MILMANYESGRWVWKQCKIEVGGTSLKQRILNEIFVLHVKYLQVVNPFERD